MMSEQANTGRLNARVIAALPVPPRGNRIHYFSGTRLRGIAAPPGFGVRVTAGGARSFILNYMMKGREHRFTIGRFPVWSPASAVREARGLRQRVDRGDNPLTVRATQTGGTTQTVESVLDDFVARYVRNKANPLRSAAEYERTFAKLVTPRIGQIGIRDLRRSDVVRMLDRIEDSSGPVAADRTLAYLRKALNWYAARDDEFVPPIVPGMARTRPSERARSRVLTDDELRLIWPVLAVSGTFGVLVKLLLLTAQRRDEVARMTFGEIGGDGIWTIPADRYKTKRPNHVPLSSPALELLAERRRSRTCDYVFASGAGTPFCAFGQAKAALDKAVLVAMQAARDDAPVAAIPNWTLHDLRRTAKTLMVRAGVRPDISERVLGHAISGVEGTYDRHAYLDEKREALARLAAAIADIVASDAPLPRVGEHRIDGRIEARPAMA